MRRKPNVSTADAQIEFVDEIPKAGRAGRHWSRILNACVQNPGRWARVIVFDEPSEAQTAQGNLSRRRVYIPDPDGDWSFAARGSELFAIYRGPSARSQVGKNKLLRAADPAKQKAAVPRDRKKKTTGR